MGFLSTIEDFLLPAAHAATGLAEVAAPAAMEHGLGHAIPLVGSVIGVGQGIYHGVQAARTDGSERADHIGAATLGALGAIPAVGSYLGAGELAWNAGAAAQAGGAHKSEEEGHNANQMIGRGLSNLFGGGTAAAPAAAPAAPASQPAAAAPAPAPAAAPAPAPAPAPAAPARAFPNSPLAADDDVYDRLSR